MKIVKTNWLLALVLAVFSLTGLKAALAQNSPPIVIDNADCVATDALGRRLPTYAEVGGPKANRHVGLFYWLWHGPDRWGADYNVTEFLKTHPGFKDFQAHPPADRIFRRGIGPNRCSGITSRQTPGSSESI